MERSVILPTDNEWGVPSLCMNMQATVRSPVLPWGSLARGTLMSGTWVFFVDDYRFGAIWREPLHITRTGCTAAVEPNVTLYEQTPRAEVLWSTYRKRCVARRWQEAGVPVFVDLNVPHRHRELCMLGVPRGWRAFATRGYSLRPSDIDHEHAFATQWSGGEPLLLVYGGGTNIESVCRSLPGSVYVPDHMQHVRSKIA